MDVVGLKLDTFLGQVLLHVLGPFVLVVTHPLGPSAGFLFHLEKGVDVGGEHGVGIGGKMPDFVDVLDGVPSIDGFLEFGGGPGTNETTFFFGVDTTMTAFGQGFGLFLFHALSTQGEGEFPATTMRKDWVVETVGWKNLTLDEPEVRSDVGAARFVEDSGMSYRVEAILVRPRIEGGEVVVVDLFSFLSHVVQFDGIGATAEGGLSGLEPGYEFEGIDQGTDRFVFSLQFFPFALPHDDDTVPQREQNIFFTSGGFVDVAHALIVQFVTLGITVRVTVGAPVPKAAVEFVDDASVFVVPVHVIRPVAVTDHVFTAITRVSNVDVRFGVLVRQPFQGREGMGFTLSVPTADRFGGQFFLGHVFGAVEQIASRGDGDTPFKWIESTNGLEFLAEHFAGPFE